MRKYCNRKLREIKFLNNNLENFNRTNLIMIMDK